MEVNIKLKSQDWNHLKVGDRESLLLYVGGCVVSYIIVGHCILIN